MTSLSKLLEAALFASARPIPTEELAALDKEASPAALQAALEELREHYDVDGHGIELVEIGGGWQILTRPEFTEAQEDKNPTLARFLQEISLLSDLD